MSEGGGAWGSDWAGEAGDAGNSSGGDVAKDVVTDGERWTQQAQSTQSKSQAPPFPHAPSSWHASRTGYAHASSAGATMAMTKRRIQMRLISRERIKFRGTRVREFGLEGAQSPGAGASSVFATPLAREGLLRGR